MGNIPPVPGLFPKITKNQLTQSSSSPAELLAAHFLKFGLLLGRKFVRSSACVQNLFSTIGELGLHGRSNDPRNMQEELWKVAQALMDGQIDAQTTARLLSELQGGTP